MARLRFVVALVIGASGWVGCTTVRSASAGRPPEGIAESQSRLTLLPPTPAPASQITVIYEPRPELAHETQLRLRARLRTPGDRSYNRGKGSETVALLLRGQDGRYMGNFAVPENVVFMTIAVENASASIVDHNEGVFWELLVHDTEGRPLYQAIVQRFEDHMGRNWLEVLQTAQTLVRLYPDSVEGWTMLRAAEGWVFSDSLQRARKPVHLAALNRFESILKGDTQAAASAAGHMYWYAAILEEEATAAAWRERLASSQPGHRFAIQERTLAIQREAAAGHPVRDRLEALWHTADPAARPRLASVGFNVAAGNGDRRSVLQWAERILQTEPHSEERVASALATIPSTRDDGITRLTAMTSANSRIQDRQRDLGATVSEHRSTATEQTASLRTILGLALMAVGRAAEAIPHLQTAAEVGWDRRRFLALAEAYRAVNDQERAVWAFAAAAVDPATSQDSPINLRKSVPVSDAAWESAITTLRKEMLRRTFLAAVREVIPPATVLRSDGTAVQLHHELGRAATVIVFWSRYCAPSLEAMPQIAALTAELSGEGVPVLSVTRDQPADVRAFLSSAAIDLNVYYDASGEAATALNNWGTPQFYVLDRKGDLRFRSDLTNLRRHLLAVLAEQ